MIVTSASLGVLDASVAVKCLIDETDSGLARAAVGRRPDWAAPDLIFLEVASVALKTLRRGLLQRAQADAMVAKLPLLLSEVAPSDRLADAAFRLAADHGFSAYDAAYLAFAELKDTWVLTADVKLASRARQVGLSQRVRTIDQD